MGKITFLSITAVFWLFMNYLLYQKEIAPFLEYEKPPSYASILKDKRNGEYGKWGLYLGSNRLGELVTTKTTESIDGYKIYTNVDFNIPSDLWNGLLSGKIITTMETNVDNNFQLVDSYLKTCYSQYGVKIEVKCKRLGEKLYFEYETPIGNGHDTIDFPKGATLTNEFLPVYGTDKLKIGKKWEIQMPNIDYLTGSVKPTSLWASVESKERHIWQKQSVDTYKIYIKKSPTKKLPIYILWVTEEGEVIEQEFDFNNSIPKEAENGSRKELGEKLQFRMILEEKKSQ